jgi:imidazolonepropionase-like amidohydrolase
MSRLLILLLAVGLASCQQPSTRVIAFSGASIIDGTGSPVIADGIVLVRDGRILAIGARDNVDIPAGAEVRDVSGTFIIPGLINAHGHVGDVKGIEGGHYSRENAIDNLRIYASYGITTVVSLGGDRVVAVPLRAVVDSLPDHARLFIAGTVVTGSTPAEALPMLDSNHHMGVDFMKIRVDDNLGTATKMTEETYRAVIERSHELGYRIATHMYYLDDAKKLLKAGSDLMAHSVRDQLVDDEFITLMEDKKVCYCPTLTRELSTFVYGDTAGFFSDPFFAGMYDSATIQPLLDPARQEQVRNSRAAKIYKQQLPTAMTNLKTLTDRGIPIAFGTDSGVPTRFMGYFEHVEMSMMAESGLSPLQILLSATRDAAACLGLRDIGTLAQGNWADFVVLTANPLEDVKNFRSIRAVFIGGKELERTR